MNVEEFVSESIKQIISGVEKARNACHHSNVAIAPSMLYRDGVDVSVDATSVEFDLAVTVETESNTKKGGEIRIFGIGGGGEGMSSTASTSVSRLRFSITVDLAPNKESSSGPVIH